MDNEIHVGDEVDESKFFAGVFTSQRSEEDLAGWVKYFYRRVSILTVINYQRKHFFFPIRYHTYFKELGNLRSQLHIVGSSNVKLIDFCLMEDDQINPPLAKAGKTKSSIKDFSRSNGTAKSQLVNGMHSLKVLKDVSANVTDRHAYCAVASRVRSVIGFVKVAYPDLIGGDGLGKAEPLNTKDRKVCRAKLLTCVERGLHAATAIQEVVYDLDALASSTSRGTLGEQLFGNWDEKKVGKRNLDTKRLIFESRFESGNLRKAIQVQSVLALYVIDYVHII